MAIVVLHGAFREPDNLFIDEAEVGVDGGETRRWETGRDPGKSRGEWGQCGDIRVEAGQAEASVDSGETGHRWDKPRSVGTTGRGRGKDASHAPPAEPASLPHIPLPPCCL